ncbi:DUF2170 family protein [Alteromonas macleodii]|uniref:DUF2170 family protein n=1 Tax=Alteromonas macleodii TaxID=28108 RepID=UPI0031405047|tara:strand:- start:5250 stop:5645 length:396 start_codon:yes stop_codon:yes gene_type:complete
MSIDKIWNNETLSELFSNEGLQVQEVEGALLVTLPHMADLDVTVVASEDKILMQSNVQPLSTIDDEDKMNALFMRNNHHMPLSHVGISKFEGAEWYCVSGELSSISKAEVVMQEINVLSANAHELAEVFAD